MHRGLYVHCNVEDYIILYYYCETLGVGRYTVDSQQQQQQPAGNRVRVE